jgi:hypothetical protein
LPAGDSFTFADVSVFTIVNAFAASFPDEWAAMNLPLLKGHQERVAARPRLHAYLAKRPAHERNSLM